MIKETAAASGAQLEDKASLRVGAAKELLCAGFDTTANVRGFGLDIGECAGRYLKLTKLNV
jgi:hypothetical protein